METSSKKFHCDHLCSGYSIPDEFSLVSSNGLFEAKVQTDGNLVIYNHPEGKVLWSSKTYGKGAAPYNLSMQTDGNIVLYDARRLVIWSSNTQGKGQKPYRLIMQDDGNLVMKDGNNLIFWATWTKQV